MSFELIGQLQEKAVPVDQMCRVLEVSRKGNCLDHAVMERFFLNLKMERVWPRDDATQCF